MQEEINRRTVALVIRAARLDADILGKAMRMYLSHRKNAAPKSHGKMTVRKLMGQDQGAASMEVKATNIRTFERVARKYNVDFAVRKEKGADIPKYTVFFKGRDTDVIAAAFREFVDRNEKKKSKCHSGKGSCTSRRKPRARRKALTKSGKRRNPVTGSEGYEPDY